SPGDRAPRALHYHRHPLSLPDALPICDLDYVPLTPRHTRPDSALALARGLEGQAVAVALGRTS
ncbi:hypothetical protein ABT086_42935, partial [Streptomyces mirabilis]